MSSETDPVTTLADLRWNEQGLIPVVVQDNSTGEVLMMAWANEEALQYTLETRKATYWSRSRSELWTKGLTSGHVQHVVAVFHDCRRRHYLVCRRANWGSMPHQHKNMFYGASSSYPRFTAPTPERFAVWDKY